MFLRSAIFFLFSPYCLFIDLDTGEFLELRDQMLSPFGYSRVGLQVECRCNYLLFFSLEPHHQKIIIFLRDLHEKIINGNLGFNKVYHVIPVSSFRLSVHMDRIPVFRIFWGRDRVWFRHFFWDSVQNGIYGFLVKIIFCFLDLMYLAEFFVKTCAAVIPMPLEIDPGSAFPIAKIFMARVFNNSFDYFVESVFFQSRQNNRFKKVYGRREVLISKIMVSVKWVI